MKVTKAVIFDLDGLLVDSEHVWHIEETRMIEERGQEYTPAIRDQVVGLRIDACLEFLRETYQFSDTVEELYAELMDRFLKRIPNQVKAKPGAWEIVEYVHEHGIPTAIASSSPMVIINAEIDAQGWGELFAVRCSAEDDLLGKPAPDVYLRAAETLGVDPASCIALEDSPNGARAAVAAGMLCYAVPDASHSRSEDFDGITPHVFPDLHEALASIKAHSAL